GRPKKTTHKSESKANQNQNETETKGIREEKIREEEMKEEEMKEKPSSTSDENTLIDIEKLKLEYDEPKLKTSFCKNQGVSESELKICLEEFNEDLKSSNRFLETRSEYGRYFLNCVKSGKYPKSKAGKKINSPTDNLVF